MAVLLFIAKYRERIDCSALVRLMADEREEGMAERTAEAMREMERLAAELDASRG